MEGNSDPIKQQPDLAVSVVIPVYNVDKFLGEAVESVLDQKLQNFEIILVNDGSSDSSAEICQKYASLDSRILFLDQENSGVSVARNNGLARAQGKYVYFLDSDDKLASDFLLSSFEIATQQDSDIVIVGEHYCKRAARLTAVPTCALFIKRALLEAYSEIRFPSGIQPCEDGLFSHQLFLITERIGFNPNGIYFYRNHENQNHLRINQQTARILKQIPKWLDLLDSFYSQRDIFRSKALKLALFIEHEPFELRYLSMSFDEDEKSKLFKLLRDFVAQHIIVHLTKADKKLLTIPFKYFIKAKDHQDFDQFYEVYLKKRPEKFKRALFWVKFIPISVIRRRIRHNIRNKYNEV
ncbi:MAG: glycosyltransferase [Sphingobacterium sp.]|jgi:glycosyltransferase involved in cell wall biosynthesis|nr:glycosyltransferase [Sphingobacterium sp.]